MHEEFEMLLMYFIILNKFDQESMYFHTNRHFFCFSDLIYRTIRPLLIDQVYIDRKNEVIKAERRLLKELGFCVYVKHSHKVISTFFLLFILFPNFVHR